MPVEIASGSLFDSKAAALVNPVNCMGVPGAGLAKQFDERFPLATGAYRRLCAKKWVKPGVPFICYEGDNREPRIIFWPTKNHWKEPTQMAWIESGANWLHGYLEVARWVPSVAVPAVGCGLGGLPWGRVRALLERKLGELPTRVLLYPPG